jgi:hypothetical protein
MSSLNEFIYQTLYEFCPNSQYFGIAKFWREVGRSFADHPSAKVDESSSYCRLFVFSANGFYAIA